MATRKRTKETTEQKISRWIAGSLKYVSYSDIVAAGWEPGQVAYVESNGSRYERFDFAGGYVVIEWDDDGNICVY